MNKIILRLWTLLFTDSSSQLGCRNSSSKPASPASRNYLLGYPGYIEELEAQRYSRELGYPGYRYRGELGYPRATYKMILRQDTLLLKHSSSHTYCRSSWGIDPEYGDTTQIVRIKLEQIYLLKRDRYRPIYIERVLGNHKTGTGI